MGVFRKVSSNVKSIENIIEELKNTGLAKEEIEMFEDVNEVLKSNIKDVNKLSHKMDKATEKWDRTNTRIERIERRQQKIKEKVRTISIIRNIFLG